ncbi:hypothetical protein SAICODRAFT_5232 [Saitoella complicata NRRL Y-17804]|nr:uncharacterized protein SAICODRAFT_5232 [Saitoella complicata NRRL Y-17804]ODQ55284.1 hypothetical protein SAICODRAFT_5232 [Saitoella complicata NRRL Y-17804]
MDVPDDASTAGMLTPGGSRPAVEKSIFAGSKIVHIKRPDGVMLSRKDIQFDMLNTIFTDTRAVFTSAYEADPPLPPGQERPKLTFADLYIEAMAKSSKCSKLLREKFANERTSAVAIAQISLLVNVGRINTTLTFFPEMRAQLRTYHPVPVLQAQASAQNAKQLQDAPRLKYILKGAAEDRAGEPQTWDALLERMVQTAQRPTTNPINLIFLFATYAPKLTEQHFAPPREFYDLFTRTGLSSLSRANAFLWLCWHYLETSGAAADTASNPFGAPDVEGTVRLPKMVHLTEEQVALENVDTEEELAYAQRMAEERRKYLETAPISANASPRPSPGPQSRTPGGRRPKTGGGTPRPSGLSQLTDEDRAAAEGLAALLRGSPLPDSRAASPLPPMLGVEHARPSHGGAMSVGSLLADPEPSAPTLRSSARNRKRKQPYDFGDGEAQAGAEPVEREDQPDSRESDMLRAKIEDEIAARRREQTIARREARLREGAIRREFSRTQNKDPLEESDWGEESDSDGGEEARSMVKALQRAEKRTRE